MQATLIRDLFGTASESLGQNISQKLGIYTVPRESYTYELSIVIVSYNTKDLLRECLQSVEREAAGLSTEIFLVDNNSSDGSPLMVETEFPQVKVMRSTINLGFGAANNLALEAAQGRYIVLLNSDAFLSDGSLRIARDHMNAHPARRLPAHVWWAGISRGSPRHACFPMSSATLLCSLALRQDIRSQGFLDISTGPGQTRETISSGLGSGRLLDHSRRSA